jgi:hypothetical protein
LSMFNNFEGEALIINIGIAYWKFLIEVSNKAKRFEFEVDFGESMVKLGLILRIILKL